MAVVALTPTGFQIILYHRYDSCMLDMVWLVMLYYRYDSCNYVRFLNYIVS